MRSLLTLAFLFQLTFTSAQEFKYPEINKTGKTVHDFIPEGWILHDSACGDLNNDNRKDLALILQIEDRLAPWKNDVLYSSDMMLPRIMVILFNDSASNNYSLKEQNNSFILSHSHTNMKDPFEDILISDNVLILNFKIFYSTGWKYTSSHSYKFKYQNDDFLLIGANSHSFHRDSGKSKTYNINFLEGKYSSCSGNEFDKNKNSDLTWRSFKMPLKSFKSFSKPLTWQFTDEIIL